MYRVKDKKNGILFSIYLIVCISIFILLLNSIPYQREGPTIESVLHLDEVELSIDHQEFKKVKLPLDIPLPARTPVTLRAKIFPNMDDGIYVHTVHSLAKVYIDEACVFEFGNPQNYPKYMKDPVNELKIIPLHGTGKEKDLRIEYISPQTQDHISIHTPMIGTSLELIMERSRKFGLPFIFSVSEILAGLVLIIISMFLIPIDRKGQIFLWLGLSSLLIGCWEFGQNPFASVIFRQNAFLYVLSYIGLFTFIVPMLHFIRQMTNFKNDAAFYSLEFLFSIGALIALFLQSFGICMLHQSYQWFHHIIPLVLLFMSGYLIREYRMYENRNARRLIFPMSVLTILTILQYFNLQPPFGRVFSSLSQMGMLIFLLNIGIFSGIYIKDSLDVQQREKELEFEKNILNLQTEEQKSKSLMLAKNEQILRQQRHDLRHQLVILQELAEKDSQELQTYLNSLMEQIPKSSTPYCANPIVNAVISHFASVCESQNIQLTCTLDVPSLDNQTTDTILCAIFSNLLENAVEACMRIDSKDRFITLRSKMHYDMLSITMDNSFNGQFKIVGDRFISSKRNEFGVGIASIEMMSKKLNGDSHFTTKDNVFLSNVYVKL